MSIRKAKKQFKNSCKGKLNDRWVGKVSYFFREPGIIQFYPSAIYNKER